MTLPKFERRFAAVWNDSQMLSAIGRIPGGRDVEGLVYLDPGDLDHAAADVGGEDIQVAPGTLGAEDSQGQGRLPGAGDSGKDDDLV